MPYKNKDVEREYRKKYQEQNKERICQYNKEYRSRPEYLKHKRERRMKPENRQKSIAYCKAYAVGNEKLKEQKRNNGTERRRERRRLVIDAYGGRCEVCGITELRFLTLDHSFQDGADHRKRLGYNDIYREIIKEGYPKDRGYRVLCWNHNCGGAY